MPSPPANDQAIRLARRAALWVVGPIALLLRGPLVELAPPARCAGALDLLSIVTVRLWPELRVGSVFSTLQAVAITLAFGCFVELTERASGSSIIALALAATLGVSPLFGVTLAPPWTATAFAACAVVALTLRAWSRETSHSPSTTLRASAALILAASIVPAWTVACALLVVLLMSRGFASNSRRARVLAAAIGAVAAASIPVSIGTSVSRVESFGQWTACVLPGPAVSRAAFGDVIGAAGPLVLMLSLLGAYVTALGAGLKRTATLATFVVLAIVPALGAGWPRGVALAPVVVGLWCLSATGMREVLTCAPRRGTAFVTGLFIAAVPLLQLSRVHEQRDDVRELLGHDRASLAGMRRLLNAVPVGSTLVEEDASADLLVRAALWGARRPTKPLAIVPLARKDVADALAAGRVFAFPTGQRELGLRGFVIEPVTNLPGADTHGIAAVSATRACVQLGRTWTDVSRTGENGRVALVADSDLARGPAVVYFSGANGYTPGPDGWPQRMMPGFGLRMFDRDNPTNAALMDAEAAEAGLRDHPLFKSPYIARLTLFRTPHAQLALPVVLGPPRFWGVGKLLDDDGGTPPLMMCDAPHVNVSEF